MLARLCYVAGQAGLQLAPNGMTPDEFYTEFDEFLKLSMEEQLTILS